jgi:phage gpG-like protein
MAVLTLDELERQFGQIAVRATDLSPAMQAGGIMAVSDWRNRLVTGIDIHGRRFTPLRFPRPQGGTQPLRNTGLLTASVTSTYTPTSFRVGTVARQAALMNYGGTVRPTNAKAITIPLTKEAVYAGRAGNMGGLFVWKSRQSGKAFLARREGSPPRLVLHWLLADKVTIPPREFAGISQGVFERFKVALVNYLRTGSL